MIVSKRYDGVLRQLEPEAQLMGVTPLTGGVSAAVRRLDYRRPDGCEAAVVVREHGEHHDGLSASLEFELLRAVHHAGIPTAEPLLVDAQGDQLGVPFLLLGYVPGASALSDASLPSAIVTMATQLRRIHETPIDTLPTLPERLSPLPEVYDYLPTGDRWRTLRPLLESQADRTYEGRRCLLHGDYWPENLLWRDDELVAVLDWEDAAFGDPLCDLAGARTELRYRFGDHAMHAFTGAYATCAAGDGPLDERRLALWQIYVASAAQHFMGSWGLPAEQEAAMRVKALLSIEEAAALLTR